MSARIASLHLYPVKSCRGIDVQAWRLDARGLRHDRRFMIVRPDGTFVTQRERPELVHVATRLEDPHAVRGELVMARDGHGELRVPLAGRGAALEVRVWDDRVLAQTISKAADRWLSSLLDEPLRLVRLPDEVRRPVDARYAAGFETSFADGYPVLVLSRASLDDLNARLPAPLPMDRFRPNIVVEGSGAYDEDRWRDVSIGEGAMRIVKPCGRCVIVTTDQATGARSAEPLRTLAGYRRQGNEVMFGQNAVVTRTGEICVGDAIVVE